MAFITMFTKDWHAIVSGRKPVIVRLGFMLFGKCPGIEIIQRCVVYDVSVAVSQNWRRHLYTFLRLRVTTAQSSKSEQQVPLGSTSTLIHNLLFSQSIQKFCMVIWNKSAMA